MERQFDIVMYHYVRDFSRTRYKGIKGLDIEEFKYQLDYLQSNYDIVKMADVVAAQRGERDLPSKSALLTFDDGYCEHYDLVFPLLFDRGLEGSFFAPCEPVEKRVMLDVNRIHFVLACCDDPAELARVIDEKIEVSEDASLSSVAEYREQWAVPNRFDTAEVIYIKRMLQTVLPEGLRNEIAGDLFARYVSNDEEAFASELYISEEQAKLMQSSGMYLGSHGYSHHWLNRIDEDHQVLEVEKSLDFLRRIGSPVDDYWVMCYPFGGWSESLLDVLRRYNCTLGLTTEVASVDLQSRDPLTLPRFDTNDFPKRAS